MPIMKVVGDVHAHDVATALGLLGVGIYLTAYLLLQLGQVRGSGFLYPCLVLIAASCVLLSLQNNIGIPSALIQLCFITISIIGISRLALARYTARFTTEEADLLADKLPDLDPARARRLLNSGRWTRVPPGHVLSTFGQPVDSLIYVSRGTVRCGVEDHSLYAYSDGFFIGEVTSLNGVPATSTCVADTPLRCFQIDVVKLRKLVRRDMVLRLELQWSMAEEMRRKTVLNDAIHRSVIEKFGSNNRKYVTTPTVIKFSAMRPDFVQTGGILEENVTKQHRLWL